MAKFLTADEISGRTENDEGPRTKTGTLKEEGKRIGRFMYIPPSMERTKEFRAACNDNPDESEDETAQLLSESLVDPETHDTLFTPDDIMKWDVDRINSIVSAITGKKV